ncbi:MAG: type II secretion system protein GspG [Candidatus Omnitrophica bacterium]|nr:type II secretion system protein GspG [Candidatus Omnitrophota bacterium]
MKQNISLALVLLTSFIFLSFLSFLPLSVFSKNLADKTFDFLLPKRNQSDNKVIAGDNLAEHILSALKLYELDNGMLPTTEQGLKALVVKPSHAPIPENWNGPYLDFQKLIDPWGQPYLYTKSKCNYCQLRSLGFDRLKNTNDDIVLNHIGSGDDSCANSTNLNSKSIAYLTEQIKKDLPKTVEIVSLEFKPDGKFLLEGRADKISRVYELITGLEKNSLFKNIKLTVKVLNQINFSLTGDLKF